MKNFFSALLCLIGLSGSAWAQYGDFTGMDISAMYANTVQNNNAYFESMTGNLIQQNMQNPQIQAMYQQYRMQGGWASFEQFAYMYGATGGFTPQGMNQYNQVSQGIQAQQQQAWSGYQAAQANRAASMNQWQNGYHANQQEAGRVMQGNMTYYGPQGAQELPYMVGPGYYTQHNQGYYVDPSYQQHQIQAGGYMAPMYTR